MGIAASTTFDSLNKNEFLLRLVGPEAISLNDSFWDSLLAFTFSAPLKSEDSKSLKEATLPLCSKLVENGVSSGNLYTLTQMFVWRCDQLCHTVQGGRQADAQASILTYNSLLLIRMLTQHLVLVCTEDELQNYFNPTAPSPPGSPLVNPADRPHKTEADSSAQPRPTADQALASPVRGAEAAPGATTSSTSSLGSAPFMNQARMMVTAESGYAVVDDDVTIPLTQVFAEGAVVRPPSTAAVSKPAAGSKNSPGRLPRNDSMTAMVPSDRTDGSLESLLDTLCSAITAIQADSDTMHDLLVECMYTFLVLLSAQQARKRRRGQPSTEENGRYMGFALDHLIMNCNCARECVRALLTHFVKQTPAPERRPASGLLGGLWSMVFTQPEAMTAIEKSPLAHLSLLLLLVLTNYFQQKGQKNPFHFSLACMADDRDRNPNRADVSFSFHLDSLYNAVCSRIEDAPVTLLLYLLLHKNSNVSGYILSRTDIENLVLPQLQVLNTSDESHHHHILMVLINLLILTQDEQFNHAIHEIELSAVPWFKDRALGSITLGSLMVVVLLRTIQFNMAKLRDMSLHNNCLATLANMSASFRNLHPFAAQRLLGLFEGLAKKHQRLLRKEPYPKDSSDEQSWDIPAIEEVLRTILEIVNAALTGMLVHNQHLVYSLLHRQRALAPYSTLSSFSDIMSNIDMVLTYFSSRLEESASGSVDSVLDMISRGARQWPSDCLARFPELRYKYVEEDDSEEFFIPYIWSLVNSSPLLNLKREQSAASASP